MTHRPWYARLLRALDRWSARVMEEREFRRQQEHGLLPSYAQLKQRAPRATPRSDR